MRRIRRHAGLTPADPLEHGALLLEGAQHLGTESRIAFPRRRHGLRHRLDTGRRGIVGADALVDAPMPTLGAIGLALLPRGGDLAVDRVHLGRVPRQMQRLPSDRASVLPPNSRARAQRSITVIDNRSDSTRTARL